MAKEEREWGMVRGVGEEGEGGMFGEKMRLVTGGEGSR
jgi:hypothetical protein